jgi:hypothetical protein
MTTINGVITKFNEKINRMKFFSTFISFDGAALIDWESVPVVLVLLDGVTTWIWLVLELVVDKWLEEFKPWKNVNKSK